MTTGNVTTCAGKAGVSGRGDGQGSAARFSGLTSIAVDTTGTFALIVSAVL